MKYVIFFLFVGLLSCRSGETGQIDLPDYADYLILEKDQLNIYGNLRTNPNHGFLIIRNTSDVLYSTKEQVNCTVSILGAYSSKGNELCLTNQMISSIKVYNRWGQEISPGSEDLEKIRGNFKIPENYNAIIKNKTILRI